MAYTKLAPGLVPVQGFVLFVLSTFFKRLFRTQEPVSLSEQDSTAVRRRHGPLRGPFKERKKECAKHNHEWISLAVVLTSLLAETSSGSVFDEWRE